MAAERTNFGVLKDVIELPDLIEAQLDSYRDFLQMGVASNRRKRAAQDAPPATPPTIITFMGVPPYACVYFSITDSLKQVLGVEEAPFRSP